MGLDNMYLFKAVLCVLLAAIVTGLTINAGYEDYGAPQNAYYLPAQPQYQQPQQQYQQPQPQYRQPQLQQQQQHVQSQPQQLHVQPQLQQLHVQPQQQQLYIQAQPQLHLRPQQIHYQPQQQLLVQAQPEPHHPHVKAQPQIQYYQYQQQQQQQKQQKQQQQQQLLQKQKEQERLIKKQEKKNKQDFSKIPGIAGHDYPIYHTVPDTSFSCRHVPALPGMYANVETGCQAYHVCHDGREGDQGSKFLCTNGTLFNQKEFACDWWYNVDCKRAPQYYKLNLDPEKNPYFQKKEYTEYANADEEQYIKILI